MPSTSLCNPCCGETVTVNVPGIEGPDGTDGTNGENAYTTTTADFVVPAIGSNVTVQVASSAWMVVGQVVVVSGPANFRVVSFPDATSVVLTFLGQSGDVAVGVTVASGSGVSPSGIGLGPSLSVYAAGTAYTLTAVSALLDFGTTDPSLTITSPGTWLLLARVRYDFAAWRSTSKTITTVLRRTNNTAANVTGSSTDYVLPDTSAAAVTYTDAVISLPPILYVTTNSTDIVQLWGSLSAVASTSGTMTAVEASIVAVKIA